MVTGGDWKMTVRVRVNALCSLVSYLCYFVFIYFYCMYYYAGERIKTTVSEWAINFNSAVRNAKQDYWAPHPMSPYDMS